MTVQTGNIILEIDKGVLCRNLPETAKDKIYKDLTFENHEYKNAEKYGGYVSPNIPKYHRFFSTSTDKKLVWFPRGYIWYLKRWLKKYNYSCTIKDETLVLPKIDISFHGELRDYQFEAVDDMVNRYPCGVLEANTGAGKTVMGCGIIASRKQPTLIIVHTKELLYQWQSAIEKFLKYDCGLIGDSKNIVKDITVGIINSVKNRTEELSNKFGQIIIDEAHRCPSNTWTDSLIEFKAKYYLGLTATAFRKDGLGNAIFAHIGPKLHTVSKKKLFESGAVLKPRINIIQTNFRAGKSFMDEEIMPYSTIVKKLTEDETRNNLIVHCIMNDLKQNKQNILVVSDRVSHCKKLAHMLEKMNVKVHVLSGQVNKNKRSDIVKDVKEGKCKILIATQSLIGEGFDAPNLTALFLTTPIKFSGRIIQTVGRVLRPEEGKIPRVYDFRDNNVKSLRYSGFHRDKIYKKEWS